MASGKPLLFTLEYTSCINIILSRLCARQRRGEAALQSLFPSGASSLRAGVPPALGKWRQAAGVGFPPGETAVRMTVSKRAAVLVSRALGTGVSKEGALRRRYPCLLLPSGELR